MILLISLAAILVIAGVFALKPVKAHGIELVAEEQAQLLPSGDTADLLSQYGLDEYFGLGLGINVIDAEEIDDFKVGSSILDYNALQDLTKTTLPYIKTNSRSFTSINLEELKANFALSMESNSGVDIFLAKLAADCALNTSIDLYDCNYKFCFSYLQDYYKYKKHIINYREKSTYEDIYSSYYLSDLNALSKGTMTYKSFFNKYGTHLVGSAIYGGKLRANYVLGSDIHIFDSSTRAILESNLSFPLEIDIYDQLKSKLDEVMKKHTCDLKDYFSVTAYGGSIFSSNSLDDYQTGYRQWCNSFENESEENIRSVIVDYTNDGLVPLWEILPTAYSGLASQMESEFIRLCNESESMKELNKFKSGNFIDYGGGLGTRDDPYIINNITHLKNVEKNLSASYILNDDIDLANSEWQPIGNYIDNTPFTGFFSGQGHTIRNLTRTNELTEKDGNNYFYYGLFGYVKGTVEWLNFEKVNINITDSSGSTGFIGIVAGRAEGAKFDLIEIKSGTCTYDHCASGKVFLGGIVGLVRNSTVQTCTNRITLTCGRYSAAVGGIAGYAYNTRFQYCGNYGTLIAKGTGWGGHVYIGGICAEIYSYIENMFPQCNNYGTLTPKMYNGGISMKKTVAQIYAAVDDSNYQ